MGVPKEPSVTLAIHLLLEPELPQSIWRFRARVMNARGIVCVVAKRCELLLAITATTARDLERCDYPLSRTQVGHFRSNFIHYSHELTQCQNLCPPPLKTTHLMSQDITLLQRHNLPVVPDPTTG